MLSALAPCPGKSKFIFFFKAFFVLVGVRKSPLGAVLVCPFHSTLAGGVVLACGLLSSLYLHAVTAV